MSTERIASIASYPGPGRNESLPVALRSLLPQVHRIYLYYNGRVSPQLAPQLVDDRIIVLEGEVDYGSCGKFFFPSQLRSGYCLTCDDDILYPPDYAEKILAAVERYRCPVSYHGSLLEPPVRSYFEDRKRRVRFHDGYPSDVEVNLLGTGTMAFKIEHLPATLSMDAFPGPNMTDVRFALWCHTNGPTRLMALAHNEGWLLALPYTHDRDTIWGALRRDDARQTELANGLGA